MNPRASVIDFVRLFEAAPEPFLVLRPDDPRFTIVAVTDEYLRVTMTSRDGPDSIIGRGLFEVFPDPPDDPDATGTRKLLASLQTVVRTGAGDRMALQRYDIRGADGSWQMRFWEPFNVPAGGANGAPEYIIHHVRDVTEREHEREAGAVEQRARAAAEDANQAKMQFLAAMSHELRTPLNAIAGYVDLLEMGIHGPITEPQKAALLRVSANQRHLLRLINDILSFAKVEAGQLALELATVRTREILTDLEPMLAPQAHGKGIAYSVRSCDTNLAVRADPERLRQILLNLVGNAIKFTPVGGWVILGCDAVDDSVAFHVRDNGPGIPANEQEAIFSPFVQIGRRLDRPQEGVGLGLAISRDLARAMKGDITVESSPGEGSAFTLTLPSARSSAAY